MFLLPFFWFVKCNIFEFLKFQNYKNFREFVWKAKALFLIVNFKEWKLTEFAIIYFISQVESFFVTCSIFRWLKYFWQSLMAFLRLKPADYVNMEAAWLNAVSQTSILLLLYIFQSTNSHDLKLLFNLLFYNFFNLSRFLVHFSLERIFNRKSGWNRWMIIILLR